MSSADSHSSLRSIQRLQTFHLCNVTEWVCLSQLASAEGTRVLPHTTGLLAFGVGCPCPCRDSEIAVSKLCGTLCHEPLFILLFPRPLAYICSKLAFQANALWIKATTICLTPLNSSCFLGAEWGGELLASEEVGKHDSKDHLQCGEIWERRRPCLPLEV